jgi:outer membrane protein assembly factor BamB
MVVGQDAEAILEQLDPTTLALHSERILSVTDTFEPSSPVLTATVGGPLWVADGEDVWALDPSTGATETAFDAGNNIDSMSTDPAGGLLYTGGPSHPGDFGMTVAEYDAHTGRPLHRSEQQDSVAGGYVAATKGGVWVSYRSGMAGSALELSSTDLGEIAPPPQNVSNGPFNTFHQIGGVWSGVSQGVLWLTSHSALTCADPHTSVVRASESTNVTDPIASGGLLYALSSSGGMEVITPPAACFGM